MIKRTSVNLDTDLVANAARILGTKKTTETLRRSLEEVVKRDAMCRLAEWELPGLTLDGLFEQRQSRHKLDAIS